MGLGELAGPEVLVLEADGGAGRVLVRGVDDVVVAVVEDPPVPALTEERVPEAADGGSHPIGSTVGARVRRERRICERGVYIVVDV